MRLFRRAKRPTLSVVVVLYNMAREAPRTLHSLTAAYQRGVDAADYEVIVVDNGSPAPLPRAAIESCGAGFRSSTLENAPPSPARAMNFGVAQARGRYVALMIDGARVLSPGVLRHTLDALSLPGDRVVNVPSWHLGPDVQFRSTAAGYDRGVEDGLLESIGWPADGYRLFDVASPAGSSEQGLFLPMAESNCLAMSRRTFDALGGYDERFDLPGGGLVNPDLYRRACERAGARLVVLLGEGTFHQVHGGATTDAAGHTAYLSRAKKQYATLHGRPWQRPKNQALYFGHVPKSAIRFVERSARLVCQREGSAPSKVA